VTELFSLEHLDRFRDSSRAPTAEGSSRMGNTESTAVNQLIKLMQTATPLKPDPSEDLMFKAPEKQRSRMTATVPSMKADVPPLPRTRAPQGTQRGVPVVGELPVKPSVRMSTALRSMSMPVIQLWYPAEGTGETDVITGVQNKALAANQEVSRPPLPRLSAAMRTEAPPAMPVAAPFEAPAKPVVMTSSTAAPAGMSGGYPSAAPYLAHVPADMTSHQPWFDAQAPVAAEIEVDFGTDRVRSSSASDWRSLIPKLVAPTLGLIVVGMFVGGFLAFDGQSDTPTAPIARAEKPELKIELKAEPPAPVAAAAVIETRREPKAIAHEPSVKPEIAEPKLATTPPNLAPHTAKVAIDVAPAGVAPATGRPAFVDVRLDSTPSGATVTLIDRGKSTFLGTTPISTVLDPSRRYQIVFSHASKPTQVENLDPNTTKRLAVVLGKSSATPKAEVKKIEASKKLEATKLDGEVVDPFDVAPKGEGVLMVSSKPPCEILVDGVATGLTTPQRALKLAAGTHKITLVNTAEKIKKTVTVTVTADQPTKVIENFMK